MLRCQVCDRRRKHVGPMKIAGMKLLVCLKCGAQVRAERERGVHGR
jgi:ribosome-binding protein aMBF1 (putative translation factor)